jgi:peptidylamidoglycolate lyase
MKRRSFIKNTTLMTESSVYITHDLYAKDTAPVYGHNTMRYRMDTQWSTADPLENTVNDCHERVQDASDRSILLTNETKNNILISE